MTERPLRIALGLAALLVAAPSPSPAQAAVDSATLARIDSLARREADAGLLSGIVLVARGDQVLLQQGYGFENRESRVPAGPATRFGIGSITKAMTEVLVALLVGEGRLELDAPVTRYLGPFPNGPQGGAVTVRHLLTHRAGVPHRVTTVVEEIQPLRPADIVDRARRKGLVFEPGTGELYSSAGFTCLARIIEVVEGKPFDAVLQDRIFRPAAMVAASDETGHTLMPHRAMPYRLGASGTSVAVFGTPYKHLGFLAGAGSVYATAEDLLHFVRALRSGRLGQAGQDLVAERDGSTWRSRYGRTDGYEASVDYDPAGDVSFVFLSNLRSAANWQLRDQIRNVLLGRAPGVILRPPAVAASFESPDSIRGSYGDPADPLVISVADGHLFRDDSEFYPVPGGSYYIPASGSTMRFRRAPDGRVDALITVSPWRSGESVALKVPGTR
jgi:CubicO group peptidase (beta-lactamase class C family)